MGRVLLISALILISLHGYSAVSFCTSDDDCRWRYTPVHHAVCKTVSNPSGRSTMECRCGHNSTCRTKGAVCKDFPVRRYSYQLSRVVMSSEPACRCPSTSLEFRLRHPPYCLQTGYTDWFQHSIPQLGFVSELVEKSPAVVESILWTFLSIMKNGSKVCEFISCGNRATMCSDINVFKKLVAEPRENKMSMKDIQTLICKILSTNMTQLYVDLTRDTLMVKDVVRMLIHMDTITHAELETAADNMNRFTTHAVALFSDPNPADQKLGLRLPDPKASWFSKAYGKKFDEVVVKGFANLNSGHLVAWLKDAGQCETMRVYISKSHDSMRYVIFMMKKVLEFTSKEDIIGTMKNKLPQTKKLLDMMDKLPYIVPGFGELALGDPLQMHNMLDKVLNVLLDDPKDLCTNTSFLEGYVTIIDGTKVKDILDLFCSKLDYDALLQELGLDRLVDQVKMWFVTPTSLYNVRFDPEKFVDDIKKFMKLVDQVGKIGRKRYSTPVWVYGRSWHSHYNKAMMKVERLFANTFVSWYPYNKTSTIENVKKFLVYLRLPIPNTLTKEHNIGFLNLQNIITIVNELLQGLAGSLDYLSTTFGNTVEMKKIVNLLTNDLPTVFEKAVTVILDHVKLAKFTKALQDEDACVQSSNLHKLIGDNPLTQLVCDLDIAKVEKELAGLSANNKMAKALYQLLFQKYDGQSFNEVAFITEVRRLVDVPDLMFSIVKAIARPKSPLKPWMNTAVWSQKMMTINNKSRTACDGAANVLDCAFRYVKSSLPVIRWKMLKSVTVAIAAAARKVDRFMIDSILKPLDDLIQGIRQCGKKGSGPGSGVPPGLSQTDKIIIGTVTGGVVLLIIIIVVVVVVVLRKRRNKVPFNSSTSQAVDNPGYDSHPWSKHERF